MSPHLQRHITTACIVVCIAASIGWMGVCYFSKTKSEGRITASQSKLQGLQDKFLHLAKELGKRETVPINTTGHFVAPKLSIASQMHRLEGLAAKVGLEMQSIRGPRSTTEGEQTLELTGQASLTEICDFLALIEAEEEIALVNHIHLMAMGSGKAHYQIKVKCFQIIEKQA